MELVQDKDFSPQLTELTELTVALKPIPTTAEIWAWGQCPLSMEEIRICQRKFGERRWLARAPRPDICARLAQLALKVNAPQESDIYRKTQRSGSKPLH